MRTTHLGWWVDTLQLERLQDLVGCLGPVERALRELRGAGRAGKTVGNYAEALAAFCSWCVDREYLEQNPLARLTRIDITPRTTRRAMTPGDIEQLLAVSPDHRTLLYEVALTTGLRKNELRSLMVRHLSLDPCGLRLEPEWTKNRKPGFQPLPQWLVEKLAVENARKASADPLLHVPRHVDRGFDADLQAAGIPKRIEGEGKLDFHALRTTYVTLVSETGASWKDTQELARHQSIAVTDRYARTRAHHLQAVAEDVGRVVLGPQPCGTGVQRPGAGLNTNGATPGCPDSCAVHDMVAGARSAPRWLASETAWQVKRLVRVA